MSILPAVVVLFFAFDEKKNPDADVLQQLEILKYESTMHGWHSTRLDHSLVHPP
jgi:hypothetical protein